MLIILYYLIFLTASMSTLIKQNTQINIVINQMLWNLSQIFPHLAVRHWAIFLQKPRSQRMLVRIQAYWLLFNLMRSYILFGDVSVLAKKLSANIGENSLFLSFSNLWSQIWIHWFYLFFRLAMTCVLLLFSYLGAHCKPILLL